MQNDYVFVSDVLKIVTLMMYFEFKVVFVNLICIVNIASKHYVDNIPADLNNTEFWNNIDRTKRGASSCK